VSAELEGSLFKFWESVSPETKIHPKDEAVFEAHGKHSLNLQCLPNPFYGPLRTAPVVLLYLNPGLSQQDLREAESEEGRQFYWRQRQGNEPLRSQINLEHKSWWVSRTKRFCVDPEYLRHKLAVLELCAYHSKTFTDGSLLPKLPSSRIALSWAISDLFAQARSRKRVVICLRSARRWGLTIGSQEGWLFAPSVTRSGYMFANEIRNTVVEAAKEALHPNFSSDW
jgi:hypothetical protein